MPQPQHPKTWLELRVLRTKDGQSLSELARRSGVALGYLSDLEAGKRNPTPTVIRKLATALNVPMSVLEPRTPQDGAA